MTLLYVCDQILFICVCDYGRMLQIIGRMIIYFFCHFLRVCFHDEKTKDMRFFKQC